MREPQIKEILSAGETEKAIEETKILVKNNPNFTNELVLLAARLETIQNEKRQGIIDDTDFRTEKNKINAGVLHILDNHHLPVAILDSSTPQKSNLKNYILVGMASLLIGFLGFYFYNNEFKTVDKTTQNNTEGIAINATNNPSQDTESNSDIPDEPITFNNNEASEILGLYFDSKIVERKDSFKIGADKTVSYLKGSLVNYYNLTHHILKNTTNNIDELHWTLLKELEYLEDEQKTLNEAGFKNGDRITLEVYAVQHPQPARPDKEILKK